MVPSSVANKKIAGPECVPSEMMNPGLPVRMVGLNTVPLGVPVCPAGLPGVGMLTIRGGRVGSKGFCCWP